RGARTPRYRAGPGPARAGRRSAQVRAGARARAGTRARERAGTRAGTGARARRRGGALSVAVRRLCIALALSARAPPSPHTAPPALTSEVDDWRDEIIYQVVIDRFANGDVNNDYNVTQRPTTLARHLGGDYRGLIEQADYLSALGVTTLWISPVVMNVEEDAGVSGYHGYWTQDFLRVNPHFGDMAELRELVAVMHERD